MEELHAPTSALSGLHPVRHPIQDIPDVGALAPGRAGPELGLVQTVAGALLGARHSFQEDRARDKIDEPFGLDGKGGLAGFMVEEEETEFELLEVSDVPRDLHLSIVQELFAFPPRLAAHGAFLEMLVRLYVHRKGRLSVNGTGDSHPALFS